MRIDAQIALEVGHHEAIIREAYKDSVGKWTWSVGLTSATGHDVERYIGKPQTMEHCLRIYLWALEDYAEDVRKAFKGHSLTKEQFAAALSFHWNTGAIKKASWVRKFKAGDMAGARRAFMNYRKPPEIIGRRKAERDLFFNGTWSNDGKITEFQIHKRSHTPNWSSAKRVDIRNTIDAILSDPPDIPAPDPTPKPPAPEGGFFIAIFKFIRRLFK